MKKVFCSLALFMLLGSQAAPRPQTGGIKTDELYNEKYRPQFHFSARQHWLNDPNGLVFAKCEYHLFFQHNPHGNEWGNMTWGHAVSRDLVHWQQMPNALEPDNLGTMFSGSAVVDWHNTSGLGQGAEPPLVAIYTAAGGTSPASKGQPFTQCLAYSVDQGRTWTKYAQNPVVKHIAGENRDPKVTWHEPTKQWIMALYLDKEDYALLASPNLKDWTRLQTLTLPGCSECPDFFEMPVEDNGKGSGGKEHRWVFTAANGHYIVGAFDGKTFTPETPVLQPDYGANYYAVQTYSDIPARDGRRIQIAWMTGGKYPQMPFNQQMSFPCEMNLRRTSDGLRLFRRPVKEIATLYTQQKQWRDVTLNPGDNPTRELAGELWDIEATFETGDASAVGLRVRGEDVRYDAKAQTVTALGKTAPLKTDAKRVTLRILADRSSLEVFGNGGAVSLTSCFLPRQEEQGIDIYAEGGTAKLIALSAHALRSAWHNPKTATP